MRGLDQQHFEYLVAVILEEDFTVREAYKIPRDVIQKESRFRSHVNAHIPVLGTSLIEADGVENVTQLLAAELRNLDNSH